MKNLTHYQVLLHRMLHQKLQWLDYYGDEHRIEASEACREFAELVVHNREHTPAEFLIQLHDESLRLANDAGIRTVRRDTLGTLFSRARDIYVALYHSDPIRTLPSDHPRFPWECYAEPPQDPAAIDIDALTAPLAPPIHHEQAQLAHTLSTPQFVLPSLLTLTLLLLMVIFITL
ncbi:hypothetical protein NFC81_11645 [Salinispirillum sp. LH 10-3-1]|uniref:DotU family type IV/VI secretion system protein n=1 Tax=Salinispirillum sp. LH 10-3-1 TaxID=2952525 RepID=A0AB38YDD1_9GAMM